MMGDCERSRQSLTSDPAHHSSRLSTAAPRINLELVDRSGNTVREHWFLNVANYRYQGDAIHNKIQDWMRQTFEDLSRDSVSFDQRKPSSSTPLQPDRPSGAGSDDLFATPQYNTDEMDTQPPPDEQPPSQPFPDEQSPSQASWIAPSQEYRPVDQSQGSLVDQSQGSLVDLRHASLVEVSEESSDEESGSKIDSVTSGGTMVLNSLGVERGGGRAEADVFDYTPEEPDLRPTPEMFTDLKVVFSCELEEGEDSSAGYKKHVYAKRVAEGGGDCYSEIPNPPTNTILLSDQACTTTKFLQALLLGVPILRVTWIDTAMKSQLTYQQCRVPNINHYEYLIRGWDKLTGEMVLQDPDRMGQLAPKPFLRQRVYLQGSRPFKHLWHILVGAGGGQALKRWLENSSELASPTIVVCEKSKVSKTAAGFRVPVVCQDWLLQCVITGNPADPTLFPLQ